MEQNSLKRRNVGVTGVDVSQVQDGYTLFTPMASDGRVYLVDNQGVTVQEWHFPGRPGRHARILGNGHLAYNSVPSDGGPDLYLMWQKYRGGVMQQVDPVSGKVVREHRDAYQHHDAHHLDDGSILYTTLEALTPEQASKVKGGVAGSEAPGGIVYADVIKHVDANNELIWEWHVIDHLLGDADFELQPHYAREHWPLINAVYPLKNGNLLCSLRSVSAVIIIDKATGDIVWKLNRNVVAQQHNATELDNGNILIFDNGAFRTGESVQFSRVIEVDPTTKEIVWQYKDRQPEFFFTPFMGSAQRLPNGNTLIDEAAFGRIFEVTKDGQVVFEYVNPYFFKYSTSIPRIRDVFPNESNALFRAYKYTPEQLPWLAKDQEHRIVKVVVPESSS